MPFQEIRPYFPSTNLPVTSFQFNFFQPSLWPISVNHCRSTSLAITLSRQLHAHCLTYFHWENFPSLLFLRITQWDSNTLTVLLNSVSLLCRIIRKANLPLFFLHSECHSCDKGKRKQYSKSKYLRNANLVLLGLVWALSYVCYIYLGWWHTAMYPTL